MWGPDLVWWVSEGFPEIGVELPCSEFGKPSQIKQKVFREKVRLSATTDLLLRENQLLVFHER